jgi:Tfp pilus assembly protein PilO
MTRRTTDMLFLGGLVVLSAAFLQFVFRPALAAESALRTELMATRASISRADDFTRGLEDLERYLREFENALAALDELVPRRIDADERVREVSGVVTACGLAANSIRPDPGKPKGPIVQHPLTVKVTGDYASVLRFVSAVESLPRHTRATRLTLENDAGAPGPLRVEVELTAFSVGGDAEGGA